ncbi:hypothetical protein L1887_48809 [Cichorium endivia]|nr:hypothetical protein L1887_48809 [Cichorium endivia]
MYMPYSSSMTKRKTCTPNVAYAKPVAYSNRSQTWFKVGGLLVVPVSVELAVFAAAQIVGIGQGARHPQDAHGKLEEQLDFDHKERVEKVAVVDERHERQEDVVAKVDDGREEAEDDEEDERAPRGTDDGVVGVVKVDDEDGDDGGGEREQCDEAGDEESDDEHHVWVRCTGERAARGLSYGERAALRKTHGCDACERS